MVVCVAASPIQLLESFVNVVLGCQVCEGLESNIALIL